MQYVHIGKMKPPAEPGSTLGRRIVACREVRGWTQKRLAEEAGISIPFLSDVENDKRSLGAEALLRLADALGASTDYLLKGVEHSSAQSASLLIPAELAAAAEEGGWSLGEAQDLLRAQKIVAARQSKDARRFDSDRFTKADWLDLHVRLFRREQRRP
jgi:transcriptional regulator with XRE-family HTH domain